MSTVTMQQGTPQAAFSPEAARESQYAQAFFYTLGDLFGGSDASNRVPTNYGQTVDIGVDDYGKPYVRGSAVNAMPSTPSAPVATVRAFEITPGMILAGAVALWLYFQRGK